MNPTCFCRKKLWANNREGETVRYLMSMILLAVTACQNSKLDSDVRKNLLGSKNDSQVESTSENAESEVAIEPTSVAAHFLSVLTIRH
jgi:hypothetical protein